MMEGRILGEVRERERERERRGGKGRRMMNEISTFCADRGDPRPEVRQ